MQTVFQDFTNAKIKGNILEISFESDNYKNILEKKDNLLKINDIIKKDGLKVKYNYSFSKKENDVIDILKEKFNKLNIKE